MQRLGPTAIVLIVLVSAMPAQAAPAYTLELLCPAGASECPVQVVDGDDALGDPALVIDGDTIAVASLHGTGDANNAPSPKSRGGQPFTTLISQDRGASWIDKPYYPPPFVGNDALGEHPAIAMSPFGAVFVASLYTTPAGEGFEDRIVTQRFSSLRQVMSQQDGAYAAQAIPPHYEHNRIGQMWFVGDAGDAISVVWNEQATPQAVQADRNATGGIHMAWIKDQADHFTPTSLITPCNSSTNPVWYDGHIHIGCQVSSSDFPWRPGAAAGDIDLFRFDAQGETIEYLGPTPLSGGAPKLAMSSDGRLAVATAAVVAGALRLDAAFGFVNDTRLLWPQNHSLGASLSLPEITEANIQDMLWHEASGAVQLILKQRTPAQTPTVGGIPVAPTFHKQIVALHGEHGLLATLPLPLRGLAQRTDDPSLLAQPDDVFNDLSDDLAPGSGQLAGRTFMAIGDYGIIQFAEVVATTDLVPGPVPVFKEIDAVDATPVDQEAPGLGVLLLVAALALLARRRH